MCKTLTGWWLNQPIWKILVKIGKLSPGWGENKKYLKFHQLDDNGTPPEFEILLMGHKILHHLKDDDYPLFYGVLTMWCRSLSIQR